MNVRLLMPSNTNTSQTGLPPPYLQPHLHFLNSRIRHRVQRWCRKTPHLAGHSCHLRRTLLLQSPHRRHRERNKRIQRRWHPRKQSVWCCMVRVYEFVWGRSRTGIVVECGNGTAKYGKGWVRGDMARARWTLGLDEEDCRDVSIFSSLRTQ